MKINQIFRLWFASFLVGTVVVFFHVVASLKIIECFRTNKLRVISVARTKYFTKGERYVEWQWLYVFLHHWNILNLILVYFCSFLVLFHFKWKLLQLFFLSFQIARPLRMDDAQQQLMRTHAFTVRILLLSEASHHVINDYCRLLSLDYNLTD